MAVAPSPPVLGVLAHDLRWTIVSLLVPGDLRTSEIVTRTGQAPSLVSYHLARLRDAGVVSVRRSTADGRDSYHALDLDAIGGAVTGMASQIHPGLLAAAASRAAEVGAAEHRAAEDWASEDRAAEPTGPPARVLFICSGNSARSPMAEGWLNHLGGGQVTARSAGISPGSLHPLAVAAMAEQGVDISGHRPTHVSELAADGFTRVITLCDKARENCGELRTASVHWSIPNPAQAHPPDLDAFRLTTRELRTRIRYLLPVLART
jgi:ArsR family transcriptional regulator, arsenate/arsenite/antimonite-responsive transcriptional repressor / arsenate reductase (thioredoxin)